MAIRDLLWRCAECGLEHGLRPGRRGEVCEGCGTRYRRGAGATITAVRPGKAAVTLSSQEWLDRLQASDFEPRGQQETTSSWRGEFRQLEREVPVRNAGRFLGYSERLGKPIRGRITLHDDRVEFLADKGESWSWLLDDITGLQPSSSSVQIKVRRQPVFSLGIPGISRRFWEERLSEAINRRWRATGRPAIREFQPRIC
jgi:hypothetical protein